MRKPVWKRLGWMLLALAALAALALTARWWVPWLWGTAEDHSAAFEGLASMIQIVIWIVWVIVAVAGGIWNVSLARREAAPAISSRITTKTETEAKGGGPAVTLQAPVKGPVGVGGKVQLATFERADRVVFHAGNADEQKTRPIRVSWTERSVTAIEFFKEKYAGEADIHSSEQRLLDCFERWELVSRDDGWYFTPLGALLFGPHDQLPPGMNTDVCVTDEEGKHRDLYGLPLMTLFPQLETTMSRLWKDTWDDPSRRSPEDGRPITTGAYPETAIIEAITNFVIHRDYSEKDEGHIAIYQDRVELTNPGASLYDADTLLSHTDLLTPKYRNQPLVKAFARTRYNQREGGGILRIRRSLEENGNVRDDGQPDLIIRNDCEDNRFTIVLHARRPRSDLSVASITGDSLRLGRKLDHVALEKATQTYLTYLIDSYGYLEFKGMGFSDRVALQLPLKEMYVPLKARVEVPEGETWARHVKVAGRPASEEEAEAMGQRLTEPRPVLDLLKDNDGLIILGDPGAGKTTFLKYLALVLAEGGQLDGKARLPILLPLSAYANALAADANLRLDHFVGAYYEGRGIDLPISQMLEEALSQGGAIVLLDGLDEVKELDRRHMVAGRVVEFFRFHRQKGNKFIVTSRIVGYRDVRRAVQGMAECTLVDFDDDDIRDFVEKWTGAIERAARGDTAVAQQKATREREELMDALARNAGVRRLAANPLLLTILALMKRQGISLPERRVELYQKYVDTLLKHWNLARGLEERGGRDLDVFATLQVLAPLALWMHETSPGVGLVKREDVRRKLIEIFAGRGEEEPERRAQEFLADVREHAGLLLERGPGEYGFIHLTFQEYLAAMAIGMQGQVELGPVVDALGAHIGEDPWREVSLLTVGYMGIVQQRPEAAGVALVRLIESAPGEPGAASALAGEAVVDAWPGGVSPTCRARVLSELGATMADDRNVAPRLRASAGASLGRLGDTRPEVMTIEGMQFCHVPAGPFWMGSDDDPDAYGDEKPAHELDIPYDYWMGRYPVTGAQFRFFVSDPEGYRGDGWWTRDGLKWRGDRAGPYDIGEPYSPPNHPVSAVTWYEALAFTRWLTARLRAAGKLPNGWGVRLPSEAEWEKAARGGIEVPADPYRGAVGMGQAGRLERNPLPKRRYPWGDVADPNRANYDESGIGATSAVGCFAGGSSPYGCVEMIGNAWEWTRSLWGKRGVTPDFKYPYRADDGREDEEARNEFPRVVRGGSFYSEAHFVRCAVRLRLFPDIFLRNYGLRVLVAPLTLSSDISGLCSSEALSSGGVQRGRGGSLLEFRKTPGVGRSAPVSCSLFLESPGLQQ